MSIVIKVLLMGAQALADKEKRSNLMLIILIPIGVIVVFISIFIYKFTDKDIDVYLIAARQVAEEMKTINKLDGNLVKGIYFLYPNKKTEELAEVSQFIKDFFVREVSETIIVDGEEIVVGYNAFKSYLEIQVMLLLPPFTFNLEEMMLVNLYLLTPAPGGTGDENYPDWGDDGSTGGGITGDIGDGADGNPSVLPFRLPSPCSGSVTSYFGMRTHPVTGEKLSFHPGTSTGHHLHFELRMKAGRDSSIDPAPYLS